MSNRMEIHSHTHFSNIRLIDSINKPKDLIDRAIELGLSGICITDHEVLGAHPEINFYQEELLEKNPGFKIGLGNEIYLVDERPANKHYHFILVAKDAIGHKQLRYLSSLAWMNSYFAKGLERVDTLKSDLEKVITENPGHVIGSTACLGGELSCLILDMITAEKNEDKKLKKEKYNKILEFLKWCKKVFGDDFYLECQPACSKEQLLVNDRIYKISKFLKIKLIVTCDAHYLKKEDREIHKAFLNSKDGEREVDDFYEYAYLQDNQEITDNLSKAGFTQEMVNELFDNTMEIYNKIEIYSLRHKQTIPKVEVKQYDKKDILKDFPTLNYLAKSNDDVHRYWVNECISSLDKKIEDGEVQKEERNNYLNRLEEEADIKKVISDKLETNMFSYPVTLQHYVDMFWECGSLVGAGRGSSCAGLNHWLLGVTQLDPIKWDLPFFRYINKERIELGDIDIDICPSKKPIIIQKIKDERGKTCIDQKWDKQTKENLGCVLVATYGTEGSRSACLTGCRGYRNEDHPDGIDVNTAQYISSLIPQERGQLWSIKEVMEGDEEKERTPITAFKNEMEKYPGLLNIIYGIEGLIDKRSSHASGVIFSDEDPYEFGAYMRTPKGEIITQYDLHMAEACGATKYDFLVTQIQDRLAVAMKLLQKYGEIEPDLTLRQVYDKYFHPRVLPIDNKKCWDALEKGKVLSVFQFDSEVGAQAAKKIKPKNMIELSDSNGLMRLMTSEKGAETPMDKYVRFKNNISLWYKEMDDFGLTKEEQKTLEPYFLNSYGVPPSQEQLMRMLMDENICNFSLKESNAARKVVAKKQMKKIPELHEQVISRAKRKLLGEYVWKYGIGPQMGYSFSVIHALAYSFIGFQTLYIATRWNPVYWNTACLIIDSDSIELNDQMVDEDDIEEEIDEEGNVVRVQKTVDYGKIAIAIGKMKEAKVKVTIPDINKSELTFSPDPVNNQIIYGLKGIARINDDIVNDIINNRPYTSLKDFEEKVKVNKIQMSNLIKCGAFDSIYDGKSREEIMVEYIESISDKKDKLTMQNMSKLISSGTLNESHQFYKALFNYNKYLKTLDKGANYVLDDRAYKFFEKNFDIDVLGMEDNKFTLNKTQWKKIYDSNMDDFKEELKNNRTILEVFNKKSFMEMWDKYAAGNISSWEMDSINFYYHDHELKKMDKKKYEVCNFFELPEDPVVDKTFTTKDGTIVPVWKISRISGTIINKDKNKNTLVLLTEDGVVNVKIYRAQFSVFDRQISTKDVMTGKKTVLEKSWFTRGNKLMLSGFRRGDTFVPKVYKTSPYPYAIELITNVKDNGEVDLAGERLD